MMKMTLLKQIMVCPLVNIEMQQFKRLQCELRKYMYIKHIHILFTPSYMYVQSVQSSHFIQKKGIIQLFLEKMCIMKKLEHIYTNTFLVTMLAINRLSCYLAVFKVGNELLLHGSAFIKSVTIQNGWNNRISYAVV